MSVSVVSTNDLSDADLSLGSDDSGDAVVSDEPSTADGDGSNTADGSGSNTADGDGTNTADGDGSSTNADGGSNTADGSGDSAAGDSSSGSAKSDDSSSSDSAKSDDSSESKDSDSDDCNLTINKTGDSEVTVGKEVTWTITVKNSLNTAKNVIVKENLPKGFKISSVNASKGTFDEKTSKWKVGDLKESESATLTIKAKASQAGTFTNTAELTTDSNNLNEKNSTAKVDVNVVKKEQKKQEKQKKKQKEKQKDKKKDIKKEKPKNNQTNQTNTTNQTKNIDWQHTGNPLLVVCLASFSVLAIFLGRRRK